jgi:hypothetical protein
VRWVLDSDVLRDVRLMGRFSLATSCGIARPSMHSVIRADVSLATDICAEHAGVSCTTSMTALSPRRLAQDMVAVIASVVRRRRSPVSEVGALLSVYRSDSL